VALLAGLTLTVTAAAPADATGGPFTCTPGFFQVLSGQLNQLNPVTGIYTPIGSTYSDTYNAMGYDTLNNYLYAIDTGSHAGDLLRIASDGSVTDLGVPSGYPGASAIAGDFDSSGDLIVQDTDTAYYSIDVASMTATKLTITGSTHSVDDLVWIDGYLYGLYDEDPVMLLMVDLGTDVASAHSVSGFTSTDGAFGAGFSDQPSDLFFADNSGQGIYSLSGYTASTPSGTRVAAGAVTGDNDGAACKLAGSPFDGPTANPDSYSLPAGQAYSVSAADGVLANDTGSEPLTVSSHTAPSHGSLTLNSDGSFTYTPNAGYSGPDSFTYVAEDPYGRTSSSTTVSLAVLPAPQDQTYTTDVNTAYSQSAPGLLSGAAGSSLSVAANTAPGHGTVSVGSTGSFLYTPQTNWSGIDSFQYTVEDSSSQTASATATIDVLPSVQSHTYSTVGTTPLSVAAPGVLSSDVGTALSATLKTAPGHGSVGIDANGSFTYTADAGFSGVDTFQYTATDSSGLSGTATVTVQVTPAAASPDYTTAADTTLTVPAGQGVAAVSDGSGLTASETSGPTHGSLSLSGDGSFSYVPDSGYSGNDSFGFEVTDSSSQQADGTASIVVTPVANPDSASTAYRTELSVAAPGVLGNDVGTGLNVTSSTAPSHGSATVNANGSYTYTPDTGYVGTDSFQYTLEDQAGSTATATVTITVTRAATSFTASANPTSTAYGNTVQLSASGLPSDATGTVTFTSGGSTLCTTGQLSSGSASCSTGVLTQGSYPVTATYPGTADYVGSTASTSFTITKAATSFTASATPTSASVGNTVQLTASGLPSGATGDVIFSAGGSTLCTTGAISSGAASCATGEVPTGSYAVTATYSGDSNYQGATTTTSFTITSDPVLVISTAGTPSGATAGTSYGLTLSPSLGASPAGPAYHEPTLIATLPSGETFDAAPSPSGWSCGLSGSAAVLTCTATSAPITAGTSLTPVTATVDISSLAAGTLETAASLADSADLATMASAAATVDVTAPPVLGLVAVAPAAASAGGTYTLTLVPSLGASGGPAYHDPTLTATLPSGETFAVTPVATGWNCSLSVSDSVLTCTSYAAPISAGASLTSVIATVAISSASGTPKVTASLTDSADLAISADASVAVDVTAPPALVVTTSGTPAAAAAGSTYSLTLSSSLGSSPAGPAYHGPTLFATLPSGETFAAAPSVAGWSCSLSVSDSVLTCTSSLAPVATSTALPGVTATVDISAGALGTLQTTAALADGSDAATTASTIASVDVTAVPVLDLSTSGTPPASPGGSTYTLSVSVALSPSGGPAYNEPTLTLVLPAGETFAAAPSVPGWSCALSDGDTTLTCVRTAATPVAPGASLLNLSVQVRVSSAASGNLAAAFSSGDSADGAVLATVTAMTTVPVATPDTGLPSAMSYPWGLGALVGVAGFLLVAGGARRRRSNQRPRRA